MFAITTDWFFTNNRDIAKRFMWSKKKKHSAAQVRWIMSRFVTGASQQDVCWEVSMMFLADKAETFIGRAYNDEQHAMNSVFRSYANWFIDKNKRRQVREIQTVPLNEEITGETQMTNNDTMDSIYEFVKMNGAEAEFFMHYLMMGKKEQGDYWRDDRKRIAYCGKVVSKQTFYNHLGAFKKALRKHVGEKNK